jgi:hypothetical protein
VKVNKKKAWPTKAVMRQVYHQKLWGDNGSKFYSGEGSHHPDLVKPYIKVLSNFLQSLKKPFVICDLGCGDFNVGKELVPISGSYIAVDIVPELIDYNRQTFNFPNLEFQCLDIAKDELPKAEIVLLRQVLQHLSNAEVQKVMKKLVSYRYVIVTEHIPEGDFVPNRDIVSGQGIRLKKQSGINLLEPPFSLKVKEKTFLLSQSPMSHSGVIVTTLFQMF